MRAIIEFDQEKMRIVGHAVCLTSVETMMTQLAGLGAAISDQMGQDGELVAGAQDVFDTWGITSLTIEP